MREGCQQVDPEPEFEVIQGDILPGVNLLSVLVEGSVEGENDVGDENEIHDPVPGLVDFDFK